MSNISVNIDTEQEQKRASDVPALCKRADLIISSQEDYETASVALREVKSRYKELEGQRKEITSPLDDAKKRVMDLFRAPLDLLSKAESLLKQKMIGYTDEQEKKAEEERKRLQKLAEAEAEKERKKLEAKIERAIASGKTDKVETLQEEKEKVQPIIIPFVPPQIDTPRGVSYREKWTAKVINFKLLPDEYKLPNQAALDKIGQATKGSISIPGVEFSSEKILASSRG